MIKINHKTENNDDKPPEMVVHYPSIDRGIVITEDFDLTVVSSFYSKIDLFIKDFFAKINRKSGENIQISSLTEIILKSNTYHRIRIEKTAASNHLSSKIKEILKKPRNKKHDLTDAVHHACLVSGCLLFDKVTPETQVYSLYFYKSLFQKNGEKSNLGQWDCAFKLCFEHGRLIIALWYLLNHHKIWTGTITECVLNDIKKTTSRKYALFIYFQRMVDKYNLIIKEREKIDLSMLYIENWTKKYLSD